MSDDHSSFQEVASLIEERRRYADWLATLDARTTAAPEHVVGRVRADYESRLGDVNRRLRAHHGGIARELAGLESRLALVIAEEKLRHDERAEIELRALVGELADGTVADALQSIDDTTARLMSEREGLAAGADRMREYLVAAAVGDDAPPLSREGESGPPEPAAVTRASSPEAEQAQQAEPEAAVAAPQISLADFPDAAPAPPASSAPPAQPGRQSTPFDELRFLNGVVGDDDAPDGGIEKSREAEIVERRGSRSEMVRPSTPVERADARPSTETKVPSDDGPFAANVPANTPIKFRPSQQMDQPKTLKCGECGALNRPTEWYCERCGAELAAL